MALTLETAKQYLRVDSDDDNSLIKNLMVAAASYMAAAVDDYSTKCAADERFAGLGDPWAGQKRKVGSGCDRQVSGKCGQHLKRK